MASTRQINAMQAKIAQAVQEVLDDEAAVFLQLQEKLNERIRQLEKKLAATEQVTEDALQKAKAVVEASEDGEKLTSAILDLREFLGI